MPNGLKLLLVLLLAGAVWLLLGETGDERSTSSDGGSLIEGDDVGTGPSLHADGTKSLGTSTAPPVAPTPTKDGTAALGVSGRVVDVRRAPVPGAVVELRLGPRVLARATSDAEGRYAVELAASAKLSGTRGVLFATTADGRRGMVPVFLTTRGGSSQGLPVIVVRRAALLRLRVVREGAGVLGAEIAVVRREKGVPLLLGSLHADEDGRAQMLVPPAGKLELYATAPQHGRGIAHVSVPRPESEGPVEIALTGERTLEVQVRDVATDRPVAGAEVFVGDQRTMPEPHGPGYLPALPPARTDRAGRVTLRRMGSGETLYVNVRAQGYALAAWYRSKTQTAGPKQTEVRVALARHRGVRFPIVEDEIPTPPEGTVLAIDARGRREASKTLRATIEGPFVIIRGVGPATVSGTLITPDGAQAVFQAPAGAEEGTTVTFRAPRTVRVRIVEPEGAPVKGLALRLNPVGRSANVAPAVTGADGVATFTGVGSARATVHISVSDRPWGGPLLGNLDLRDDIEVHELVLQTAITVTLRVSIDGEPRLPAGYTLLVGGQRIDPGLVVENASTGELRFPLRPPATSGETRLDLHAEGFLPTSVTFAEDEGAEAERTVELRPAGTLVVRVTPPEDTEYRLQLQRADVRGAGWRPALLPGRGGAGPGATTGPGSRGHTHVFEGLSPGSYRVLDLRSRQAGEPIEVLAGGGRVEHAFDLSAAVWIRGTVTAPVGTKLIQARVVVEGRDDPGSVWTGVRPASDGTFRVRGTAGQRVTLRVTHPTLTPAAQGGTATVVAGRGEVTLRLEVGGELRFRAAGFEDAHTPDSGLWYAPLQVHLIPEKGKGRAAVIQPVARAGTFRAGGFAPGTYTLWIVFGSAHPPLIRRGLELGTGSTDLGVVRPPRGSTVRIRVAGLAQKPGATVWAVVNHEGKPAYTRHGRLDRETGELTCSGLGAGSFRVVVRGAGLVAGAPATRVLLEKVVTLDGESETTLDVSVR